MVGVVYMLNGEVGATRTIRDDVLDSLYGKASKGVRKLIEQGLRSYKSIASGAGVPGAHASVFGLHPSEIRETDATSAQDVIRTAALLYSSLS